tara:strand:+ start:39103 stop:40176 length:1074 start_codon:yes stop_codon:yes gene_type:complete
MKVFVGCYTKKTIEDIVKKEKGIYCFDFDSIHGQLKLLEIIPALNPSYLTLSKDKKYLYALEEIDLEESPKIKSFKINYDPENSHLKLINEQEIDGSYPCHINTTSSQSHVLIACYMTGNMLVYPLGKEGRLLPSIQNCKHIGDGPNLERQEAAHAHMIYTFGKNELFVVDLGLDIAKAYKFSDTTKKFMECPKMDISITKGSGARHMVLHKNENYAFIFSELTSQLFSFKRNNQKFIPLETLSSLPSDFKGTPSGATIRIHRNGKFIYVSNRGHDSIVLYHFNEETEKLVLLTSISSGGKTPREINIDPTGKWLLVANQDSNNIVVFSIDQESGFLKRHSVNTESKSANCIQFLDR